MTVDDSDTTVTAVSLFDPVVEPERWHTSFKAMKEQAAKEPARIVMDRLFTEMGDRDGNFREQFQTTGFDARVWELYLFAALRDIGLEVELPPQAPDFVAARGGTTFAVEATTANLRDGESPPVLADEEELLEHMSNELPIRLGSPLFSKLQRSYTDRSELAQLPFVLALECFVSPDSMFFSESPLGTYLYGVESVPTRDNAGSLVVRYRPVHEHRVGDKMIPSGFFMQDDAGDVAAVLFSNSGTIGKFDRMGYQEGIANECLWMGRYGFRADNDPNAAAPVFFAQEVGARQERWSDGLVVFHNPGARRPLSDSAFGEAAVQYRLIDGQIRHTRLPFHVLSSQTITVPAPAGHGVEVARFFGLQRLSEITKGVEQQLASAPPRSA